MNLFLSIFKSGVFASTAGVFGSAGLWLISFKVVAHWLGPEGVGLFSQLRQIAQAATVSATFGGTNSVVQGLADRHDEPGRRRFSTTAARLFTMSGVAVTLAMLILAPWLARFLLASDDPELTASIRWIAVAVLLNVGGTYALGVLNGYRSFGYFAAAQIAGPATMAVILVGAWRQGLASSPTLMAGAFVICFGMTFVAGALGLSRLRTPSPVTAIGRLTPDESRAFIRFALSTLLAALSSTVAILLIRSWMIEANGLAFAGLFDAGWTLTFNYTTLFLTACNAIYLPLLTASTREESQKSCVLKTTYIVLSASVLICYLMVMLSEPLIEFFYSPQFHESSHLLMVLVIAVVFRSTSWVYGAMIVATRNSKALIVSDLTLNLILLGTTWYALGQFSSLEAIGWAFVFSHFLYLVFVVEYACLKNKLMRRRQVWPLVIASTAPLFFLALDLSSFRASQYSPFSWLFFAIGLGVICAALLAYTREVR